MKIQTKSFKKINRNTKLFQLNPAALLLTKGGYAQCRPDSTIINRPIGPKKPKPTGTGTAKNDTVC